MRVGSAVTLSALLVATTGQILNLPVVDQLVGSIVNSFSQYLDYNGPKGAVPGRGPVFPKTTSDTAYWLADIAHHGYAAFNPNASTYQVFRNVKDFGAKGDGVTDDTAAINAAMSSGGRFGPSSGETTTITPAVVYFPAGTYVISSSIVDYYLTQIIGNPNSLPVIQATANFTGLGLIDGDQYGAYGLGWGSTNVFFRQVRNLILDLTAIPASSAATGIHWPTAQATSLQNVEIYLNQDAGTQHQGILVESGSAGFITDVTIIGGLYGANLGNQQYTMRNLTISNSVIGINQLWDWGWTYVGIKITNCSTAFSMTAGGSNAQAVGSVNIIDSVIADSPVFVDTVWSNTSMPAAAGSLILENIQLSNVPVAVQDNTGIVLAGSTGSMTISGWGQGHEYTPNGPVVFQGHITPATRPSPLLAAGSANYYTKTKPQYETYPVSSFMTARSFGAAGDGVHDDTLALQLAIDSAALFGRVLFVDYGVYKVSNTLRVPPGSRIVGESYAVIMASGGPWSRINNPVPVVQIGLDGQSGSVEWSDMIVSTQGSCPGAVLIEWNLKAKSGSGMWDVHTRIGGFDGSELQVAQCPTSAPVSANCEAAYMSMHITSSASGVYLENNWFWTADHDIDNPTNTQVSIYTGRGLLIEASVVWLYGTSVEHHSLYQYQFANAKDIMAGFIQTETPYYQPQPDAPHSPYYVSPAQFDPEFGNCLSGNCDALGLRIFNSQNVAIYGAGHYSFFNYYSTVCSDYGGPENCQSELVSIEGTTSNVWLFSLNTIGTPNMIVLDGRSVANYTNNIATYPDTIAYFAL